MAAEDNLGFRSRFTAGIRNCDEGVHGQHRSIEAHALLEVCRDEIARDIEWR